ncbi:glutamate 5-kinase [Calditerrivibrio nitroreducens]|uniref:Glutamate 5-kinase n=1 Tax=Calditerrivibrio nitroreducens (strain DSM 19672 / NBRC 101217 / Yu37-1) TaxID=768670 RepID=E4TJA1_CALNY|nr:glutamate 5-kinase [Calditerrivibrio nitroreducens]ADR19168.1 glutamate 5-kinase [Calditerrivibrio nitroreducens DSM 19672]
MRKLPKINTVVIKIGSSIIAGKDKIDKDFLSKLASVISEIRADIKNIVIVSSGAVAAGFKLLGFKSKPKDIADKQACAAVGQAKLIQYYEDAFKKYNLIVGQVLLVKDDFSNRKRYLNARTTIKRLLDMGVIPIINENDTVAVHELKYVETFGDNDNLSALVGGLLGADMLLILSDVDGLFDKNPLKYPDATLIKEVKFLNEDILNVAGESVSGVGTGGMKTKLVAARKALDSGCYVGIINGKDPYNVKRFLIGDEIGTFFSHVEDVKDKRKFWIAYAATPKGEIIIDNGAVRAISEMNGSLLPSGILDVSGKFGVGDVVKVVDIYGIEIARGKTRYSSSDVKKIKGVKSDKIDQILGFKIGDEVIHKDDLVLSKRKGV